MYRLIFLVNAGALLAPAQIPAAFWPQIAIGPPGTNQTVRTEVVPGLQGGVPAPAGGGIAVGPIPGQPSPGRSPSPGGGAPSIVMGASGVSTPTGAGSTSAPAVLGPSASQCEVRLTTNSLALGPNGGPVDVSIEALPDHCKPSVGATGPWLQPVASGHTPALFRFSAAPNTSPIARAANIVIGGQLFVVQQEGLIRTRLAASPDRVVLALSPKYKEQRREIALWADKPGTTLAVSPSTPWIRLEAKTGRKPESRRFDVIVDNAKIPAGARLEGTILVSAEGAPPLSVPVIVERGSLR